MEINEPLEIEGTNDYRIPLMGVNSENGNALREDVHHPNMT